MIREHIAACPACRLYAQNLSDLEFRLRHSLQSRYPETSETLPPSIPTEGIQARSRRDQMTRSIFRTAAWLAVAALFVFAISWAIRNTAPQQPITAGQTAAPAHTPTPSFSPTPNPTAVQLPHLPAPAWEKTVWFSPTPASSFPPNCQKRQHRSCYTPRITRRWPAPRTSPRLPAVLSPEAVSRSPGEGSDPVYHVSDGFSMLTFAYNSPTLDITSTIRKL